MILGIDSSTDKLGIGLHDGNRIVAETLLASAREHASRIIGMIDDLLVQAALTPKSLTGLAVALGPGSFTGLRVGLAVAKGMALALYIPIVGVPTFEVMTRRVRGEFPEALLIAPIRRGEFYVCRLGASPQPWDAIDLVPHAELAAMAQDRPVGLVGKAPEGWNEGIAQVIPEETMAISGGEVAACGGDRLASGYSDDVASLEPLYIAPSQAEQNFDRRR